jgi:hypothetical protein
VNVFVTGVKKKARKMDRHMFRVTTIPYTPDISDEEKQRLMTIAKGLVETNMRVVKEFSLEFIFTEDIGDDLVRINFFSDKNIRIEGSLA